MDAPFTSKFVAVTEVDWAVLWIGWAASCAEDAVIGMI
jgi:hypothetical protein